MKLRIYLLLAILSGITTIISGQELIPSDWTTIGRGSIGFSTNVVQLKECFIHGHDTLTDNYQIQFTAITPAEEEQVQIWSGFGFQDRDNRYALGLRGGNSNDLYLCRYETLGKDKMLALAPIEFEVIPGKAYPFNIIFSEGTIWVYLNNEKQARIIVKDESPLLKGLPVLGGGWIPTIYRDFSITPLSKEAVKQIKKDSVQWNKQLSVETKEIIRQKARATYNSKRIAKISSDRTEVSLNGNWLFKPAYEIDNEAIVTLPETDDQDWHILEVPQFWNPVRNWLHLQESGLPHMGSGVSDNYREQEETRCDNYTFDYKRTRAAWYRHWIELPENIKDKTVKIQFDAVSKIAEIYVNGNYVGGNIGMFGYFDFDISNHLKPGKNLIAVQVKVRRSEKPKDAEKNVARAVSVDITNDMLNSLPHGMFAGTEGGIWQPVKLIITNPVHVTDIFAQVNMAGGNIHVSCYNPTSTPVRRTLKLKIQKTGATRPLYESGSGKEFVVPAGDTVSFTYKLPALEPKLWSPENPNLYKLDVQIWEGRRMEDRKLITIGFRTFEVRGNRFYLNGNPYWLRGANHPPCGIAPNDSLLANRFFKLMHEGNQMVTRSHASPFTQTWMDAADRQGVAVSFEGTWPWFLIKNMPDKELITIWREEFIKLVKRYRNHPALFVWTINNEMSFTMFYHGLPEEQRLENWTIISDVIKEIRKLHPGIPISGDSGYNRVPEDYEKNLKPNGIDDGDTDDRHVYFNWYNRDFFQIFNGEFGKRIYWSPGANPDRPYFGQEVSTGYPNNDVGHFCRKYIYQHYVPHAYYGDWAWEDHDPSLGLKRHAFMTKELAEVIRRTSPEASGLLLFANVCWYQNVFQYDKIKPYPVHHAIKLAYQPVLPSLELFGRNFYAGSSFVPRFYIVNDDIAGNALENCSFEWQIKYDNQVLAQGVKTLPKINHDTKFLDSIRIDLPKQLPAAKINGQIKVNINQNGVAIANNEYDIILSQRDWVALPQHLEGKSIGLFDLTGETRALFEHLGIAFVELEDLTQMRFIRLDALVVANLDSGEEVPYNWEDVKNMPARGVPTLLIHPGKHLQWLYWWHVDEIYERKGRIVHMKVPEHPVFKEIEPFDLAWWQQEGRERPRACRRSYRFKKTDGVTALCSYLRPHVYISKPEEELPEMNGVPLVEMQHQGGKLIASELELNSGVKDPVAARVFVNILTYLLED